MTREDSTLLDTVFDNVLKCDPKSKVLLVVVKAVCRFVSAQDAWNVARWGDSREVRDNAACELQDASDALRKLVQS